MALRGSGEMSYRSIPGTVKRTTYTSVELAWTSFVNSPMFLSRRNLCESVTVLLVRCPTSSISSSLSFLPLGRCFCLGEAGFCCLRPQYICALFRVLIQAHGGGGEAFWSQLPFLVGAVVGSPGWLGGLQEFPQHWPHRCILASGGYSLVIVCSLPLVFLVQSRDSQC